MKLKNLKFSSDKIEVFLDTDLTSLTTMKLKSQGNLLKVYSEDALVEVISNLATQNINYQIIGWGANTLLSSDKEIFYIKLSFKEENLTRVQDEYSLPASFPLNKLTAHAIKHGLKGWEVFTGVPASLGGALYMNAGTSLGEICGIVKSITVLDKNGNKRVVEKEENTFKYRGNNFLKDGEIILSAILIHHGQDPEVSKKIKDYIQYRKRTQPLASRNCGCVFKNPEELGAGLLIDKIGMKGLTFKDLQVSHTHANFIEHNGSCNLDDFHQLVSYIKALVYLYSGQKIECEVQYPYNGSNETFSSIF